MSAHTWLTIGLCALPLLIWIPLRLLDAGREPDNSIRHEQEHAERDPDEAEMAAAA